MQTSEFGKSKGLWKTLTDGSWGNAFDGLGISLLLTSNPAIQVPFSFQTPFIFIYYCLKLAITCLAEI
jgi:hypothetical protein